MSSKRNPPDEPPASNAKPARGGDSEESTRLIDWIDWLPWEKILIWGLFLLAVYTLRHFFLIIFMTFILSYILRSIVVRIRRIVSPRKERVWLERGLTLICFAALLFGLYSVATYVGPRLFDQGKALVHRGSQLDIQAELGNIVTKTVGYIQFQRDFGGQTDPRYQEAFEEFQKKGAQTRAYASFPALRDAIERLFLEEQRRRIQGEQSHRADTDKEFDAWLLKEKARSLFEAEKDKYVTQWEEDYKSAHRAKLVVKPLEEYREEPDFEKNRDEILIRRVYEEQLTKDSARRQELRSEWEKPLVDAAVASFQSSPEYNAAFEEFYRKLEEDRSSLPADVLAPGSTLYPYEKYVALQAAHKEGQDAFLLALQDAASEAEENREARLHAAFEYEKQRELARDFMASDKWKDVLGFMDPYGQSALKSVTDWLRGAVGYLLTLPVQLGLSLLLSFFITFDIARIRKGIFMLKQSRVSDFYEEIAPGLYNFGLLIGRAFQAQGVIAFFNTVLTFLAIHTIGIQNEIFLCAIVFICSFIPVVGVVMSSVPIAIVAISQQPDGSLLKALTAIGAVLVIHFIETSLLNPKILGDMLHLHPVLVLIVLAVGEHFAGIWGLLLGVPISVYIIRCVILNQDIPGLVEQARPSPAGGPPSKTGPPSIDG